MSEVIASNRWVDVDRGVVSREIFSDPDIYQLELDRIFARGWNFMCHVSQLREAGSFFMNWIGEDQVIVVRDRAGEIHVLLNSCPHRGNTVCRAEQGRTRSFFCSYHGWNFDLDGRLIAVPGQDKFYGDQLDFAEWGLAQAPRVENYKGFVFASLDAQAPALGEYLGWVGRLGIDQIAEQGDMEVVDGIQKNRIQCNWKLAVDNLFDWYHPKVSHQSAIRAGVMTEESLFPENQMVILGEYGHAIGGPGLSEERQAALDARQEDTGKIGRGPYNNGWRARAGVREAMGEVGIRSRGHPNIFPNVWITLGGNQICLRLPKGPDCTELWWFTLVEKSMTPQERRSVVQAATHFFGPAGLLEQDDGENWSHSTRGARGNMTRRRPLNYSMRKGLDEVRESGGQAAIETVISEHAQLWTYRCWEEWMRAATWSELEAQHSAEPQGCI